MPFAFITGGVADVSTTVELPQTPYFETIMFPALDIPSVPTLIEEKLNTLDRGSLTKNCILSILYTNVPVKAPLVERVNVFGNFISTYVDPADCVAVKDITADTYFIADLLPIVGFPDPKYEKVLVVYPNVTCSDSFNAPSVDASQEIGIDMIVVLGT